MVKRKVNAGIWATTLLVVLLVMVIVGKFNLKESTDISYVLVNQKMLTPTTVETVANTISQEAKYKGSTVDIMLEYQGKYYPITLEDMAVSTDIHTILQDVSDRNYAIDHKEEFLGKFIATKQGYYVAIQYLFPGIADKIEAVNKEIQVEPKNSKIVQENGKIVITEEEAGYGIDTEKLYESMTMAFYEMPTIHLSIPIKSIEPTITKEDNQLCCFVRSTFSTNVSDSTGNRKHNVSLALEKLNGLRVEPGQTISFNEMTGPHTKENGYKSAIVILNGQYTDGVGGGVCQASTTLYNALLKAGLQIDQVQKHTLPVKYVPLALDAMVSGSSDLVFTNNLDHAITILTSHTTEDVTVKIIGEDMKDITYETRSELVRVLPHLGDKIIKDEKGLYKDKVLFEGEQYRLSYPRQGYEVKAYLEKYQNGTMVESDCIRHVTYQPQQGTVVEGVEKKPETLQPIQDTVDPLDPQKVEDVSVEVFDENKIEKVPTSLCP